MQPKFMLCLALACLAVLPALNARSLENGENELMEMAIQALEHGRALTAEESMVMQSGTYGAGMVGAYGGSAGGILDSETTQGPALESGSSNSPAATTTTTPTAAKPAAAPAAKSSALSAHQSAGLLAAGVMAAVFLL